MNSKYIAFYKGTPVIKIDAMENNAFSFGVIVMGNGSNLDQNTVKHEYGHTRQLKEIGVLKYVRYVAIPSLYDYWGNTPYRDYYSEPQEYGADLYGGVNRVGYPYKSDVKEIYDEYWSKVKAPYRFDFKHTMPMPRSFCLQ